MKDSFKLVSCTTLTPKILDEKIYLSDAKIEFKFNFKDAKIAGDKIKLFYNTQAKLINSELEIAGEFYDHADIDVSINVIFTLPISELYTTINNKRDFEEINDLDVEIQHSMITNFACYNKQIDSDLKEKLALENIKKLEDVFTTQGLLAGCTLECVLNDISYIIGD